MRSLRVGERVEGKYEVLRLVGEGALAQVVEVRHVDLGTRSALKVLVVRVPGLHSRLELEGRIQATLESPFIVKVHDVVRSGGMYGLVMQLIEGPSLERFLEDTRPTIDQVDDLARGILSALVTAHASDCLHRDLKPANILLEVADDRVVPKVADFGLAKALTGDLRPAQLRTVAGRPLGTAMYMAPEQFRDARTASFPADVFSLGATLFELLTGQPPYQDGPAFEVFERIRDGNHPRVHDLVPDAPDRMAHAIEAALRPDAKERPPTSVALRDLWIGDTPPIIHPVWTPDQLDHVRRLAPPRGEPMEPGKSLGPGTLVPRVTPATETSTADLDPVSSLEEPDPGWSRAMTSMGIASIGLAAVFTVAFLTAVGVALLWLWG